MNDYLVNELSRQIDQSKRIKNAPTVEVLNQILINQQNIMSALIDILERQAITTTDKQIGK